MNTNKEKKRPLIHFGAIHTDAHYPNRRYVIIDTGKKDWFSTCQLNSDGRLGLPGTGTISDIGEIIGTMTLKDIIQGLAKTLVAMSPQTIELLTKASKARPRRLHKR